MMGTGLLLFTTLACVYAVPEVIVKTITVLEGQDSILTCTVGTQNGLTQINWMRIKGNASEEWVSVSKLREFDDGHLDVDRVTPNIHIENARVSTDADNTTISSTLELVSVKMEGDGMYEYFCVVNYEDENRGWVSATANSERHFITIFRQPSSPTLTGTVEDGFAEYKCNVRNAGFPPNPYLKIHFANDEQSIETEVVNDHTVKASFVLTKDMADKSLYCTVSHEAANLIGAVKPTDASIQFRRLVVNRAEKELVDINDGRGLRTINATMWTESRAADQLMIEEIFEVPIVREDTDLCAVTFLATLPDDLNPIPTLDWYVNTELKQSGRRCEVLFNETEEYEIVLKTKSPFGENNIYVKFDTTKCFPPVIPTTVIPTPGEERKAETFGSLAIVLVVIIVIVVVVVAVIIVVMIKKRKEKESDMPPENLNTTSDSITYQPATPVQGVIHESLTTQLGIQGIQNFNPLYTRKSSQQSILFYHAQRPLDVISEKSQDVISAPRAITDSFTSLPTDAEAADGDEDDKFKSSNATLNEASSLEDSFHIEVDKFMNFSETSGVLEKKLQNRFKRN